MSCKTCIRIAVLAVSAVAVAGCTPVDHGFGEALRYDMALQTINPDPVYAEGGAQPGDHGEKATEATKRYREGNVTPVESQTTTSGTSGSGSGPN